MIDPTYHGNLTGDLWLLMRLVFTTLARTWLWLPIAIVVVFEWYCRHEAPIRARFRTPAHYIRPSLERIPKAKARKAVA